MNSTKRRLVGVCVGLAGVALPLLAAGVAHADSDDDPTTGYPSTQSPLQGLSAGTATLGNTNTSFLDAVNGDNRPDGANGTETEFPQADPRFLEGPVGGLLVNGPLE